MENREFKITGLTLGKELQLGFLFGTCFILIWLIFLLLYYIITDLSEFSRIPSFIFLSAMFLALGLGFLILRLLGKKKRMQFLFDLYNDQIVVKFGSSRIVFPFNEIEAISLVGTLDNMRFFKIISKSNKLKIRIGTYNLAPFSDKEDIFFMDLFMNQLEIIFKSLDFKCKKVVTPYNSFEIRLLKK